MLIHGNLSYSLRLLIVFSFSELEIPQYVSKDQFYEKLFLAISEGKEGFYIA